MPYASGSTWFSSASAGQVRMLRLGSCCFWPSRTSQASQPYSMRVCGVTGQTSRTAQASRRCAGTTVPHGPSPVFLQQVIVKMGQGGLAVQPCRDVLTNASRAAHAGLALGWPCADHIRVEAIGGCLGGTGCIPCMDESARVAVGCLQLWIAPTRASPGPLVDAAPIGRQHSLVRADHAHPGGRPRTGGEPAQGEFRAPPRPTAPAHFLKQAIAKMEQGGLSWPQASVCLLLTH